MAKPAADPAPRLKDFALWGEAVRDVQPLRGRVASIASSSGQVTEQERNGQNHSPPGNPKSIDCFDGIDRASAERLKRGLRPIEARLDLHGLTQAEAHRQLVEFVEASYRCGTRCLLVITGRGLGPDGPGVLKSSVPRWLGEAGLRRRVLAIAQAQPQHGGAGAFYVLLRRQR